MTFEVDCGNCGSVAVVKYDLDDDRYIINNCNFCGSDDIAVEEIEE